VKKLSSRVSVLSSEIQVQVSKFQKLQGCFVFEVPRPKISRGSYPGAVIRRAADGKLRAKFPSGKSRTKEFQPGRRENRISTARF